MSQPERLTDEWLVLGCQAGEPQAFEALVDRWQRRLWRHAWRLTGDEDAAWDVVQEAWIGISGAMGRLADAARFPAWAYQVVSNKCRDWVRREQRRRRVTQAYFESLQSREVAASAANDARHGSLKEAVEQLAGPDRALLSLRYEEQFSTAEIAGILGLPEGTVKSRLFYVRERLRKYLEEADER